MASEGPHRKDAGGSESEGEGVRMEGTEILNSMLPVLKMEGGQEPRNTGDF